MWSYGRRVDDRRWIFVAAVLLGLSACGDRAAHAHVTREEFGADWPLLSKTGRSAASEAR